MKGMMGLIYNRREFHLDLDLKGRLRDAAEEEGVGDPVHRGVEEGASLAEQQLGAEAALPWVEHLEANRIASYASLAPAPPAAVADDPALDAAVKKQLRSLGYVD